MDASGKVLPRAGDAGADDGAKASGLDKPAESSKGKPLTTVSVTYEAPVGT